jgi:hypothetical protein
MKKMNKTYEAPEAEVIEMQMPVVLTVSAHNAIVTPSDDVSGDDPWG